MAGCDYANCDYCGRGKVFYDANIDWEGFRERIGLIRVMCVECYKSGIPVSAKINPDSNYLMHYSTAEYASEFREGE